MNRISSTLHVLLEKNEKALVLFLTMGFPELRSALRLIPLFEQCGADMIELGMPFSDPLADGPVIQRSSQLALKNGITLKEILGQLSEIRRNTSIPLILMGYLNPILSYSTISFFKDAATSGADGIILPELPLEEVKKISHHYRKNALSQILLVSPTTPVERMKEIDRACSGFLYCVSSTGVTGNATSERVESYLNRVKQSVRKNPVLAGFGIGTPQQARRFSPFVDGVIVGSALIRKLEERRSEREIGKWITAVKHALNAE
ncbi:MAG: tryptophan synthase subunit alpha [bacterium]